MIINKRLKLLVDWINKSNFNKIADIGTDHGKLLIEIAKTDDKKILFGIDIIKSIIDNLNENKKIKNIKWINGFGLNPLQDEQLDVVVMSGIGMIKMLKILKLDSSLQNNIILQTNENLNKIRQWVNEKGYLIKKENIMEEKGYFYHSIFISKFQNKKIKLTENEIFFGPILIKEKTKIFLNYWSKNLGFLKENIVKIKDEIKKKEFQKKIEKIENIIK